MIAKAAWTKRSYRHRPQGCTGLRIGAGRGLDESPMACLRWVAANGVARLAFQVVLILGSTVVFAIPAWADSARQLKVLIRYDDFSQTSNAVIEEQLFEAVRKAGGRTLVSVIPYGGAPYPRPDETPPALLATLGAPKLKQLKDHLDKGDITIALHGYSHRNNAPFGAPKSEFAGMPPELQSRLLKLAKRELEAALQIDLDVFVPPWNSYDEHMTGALREVGIHVLSSSLDHSGPSGDLQYVPGNSIPRLLKFNVSAAMQQGHLEGILVVTVHPYDFTESGEPPPAWRVNVEQYPVADVVQDVAWVANQTNVKIVSIEELRNDEDLSLARLEANRRLRTSPVIRYGVNASIFGMNPIPRLLYPRDIAEGLIWRQDAVAGLIYGGSCFLAFLATRSLCRASGLFKGILGHRIAVTLALATVGFVFYAMFRHMHIALLAIALWMGIVLALARAPRRRRPAASAANG